MLGMPKLTTLVVTTLVLLCYATLGGARADILTDGAQGFLMVVLAIAVIMLFMTGTRDGGFIAALAGPLVLGSIWNGVTAKGALAGFWTGGILFILIHAQIISSVWPTAESLQAAGEWFSFNARSPYSAAFCFCALWALGHYLSKIKATLLSIITVKLHIYR